ncbi:DNA polymerase I [Caulobacter phage CcrRogue]|uniref:Putative T7-like Pol I DNA polymerase n=1 Tax=Caulobacter phage CcrRogue TaxID=2927986 RepID=K4K314_9CAUD|nr:DNA polymerase I [Caulobacter phage CcrRogue]AFU86602.1 putative T7-like Pol I DNA polymerase [Caulobacter phage CcrRogue]
MKLRKRRLLFDLETDGLLLQLTRIHILVIKDADTRQRWVFHRNKREDNILEGIKMLNEAEMLIGHNIVGFDCEALKKVYGNKFNPQGILRDTLVMTRMLFADLKDDDFRMWKRGDLYGGYIGSHELGAWGQRLGFPKGDYADVAEEEAKAKGITDKAEISRYVWGTWNQDMEDYAIQDVEVTEALWRKIESRPWSKTATTLEHMVHDMMERVQRNGFPFHRERARRLEDELRTAHTKMSDEAIKHFGSWWVPGKWLRKNKSTTYCSPETGKPEKDQVSYRPRPEFGEDDTREHWAEVTVPSRDVKYKDPMKGDRTAGAPFCPVKITEFNPNSRQQIVDRLTKVYGWEPQEFTENNAPVVDDEVLRDLAKAEDENTKKLVIPICETLAEIFYYKKRLGQLVDGKNGWLAKCEEWNGDGKIHGRVNVGGTVTNRASHSNPNIAQVPRVVFKSPPQWKDEAKKVPLLGPDGKQIRGRPVLTPEGEFTLNEKGEVVTKKVLMKGREGDHGWDSRDLFYVPEGWVLMGADQAGIELRCLAHFMAEFDNGQYGKIVLDGDVHGVHQAAMEMESRDTAKTFIYAMIYGAQDYKLGCTVDPTLTMNVAKAKALGSEMRRRIMTRIPALQQVVKAVQREAKRGYVDALDGRLLYVRAKHSALNTKLQGAGATIAKGWCVNFETFNEDDGLVHGWDGDYAVLAWVHDEMQVAVRDDPAIKEICRRNIVDAAKEAGHRFDFRLPVDVDVKWGRTWAETH